MLLEIRGVQALETATSTEIWRLSHLVYYGVLNIRGERWCMIYYNDNYKEEPK